MISIPVAKTECPGFESPRDLNLIFHFYRIKILLFYTSLMWFGILLALPGSEAYIISNFLLF